MLLTTRQDGAATLGGDGGGFYCTAATADEIVRAGRRRATSGRGEAGQYDIVVAEKNVAFTKAIRRWAESHGKLKATDEVGGSKATNSDSGGGGFHCPNFVSMTWPNYSGSSDDLNDIGSWGEIGSLEHKLRRKSLNSIDSAARRSDGSVGAQESEVADEDVEEFLFEKHRTPAQAGAARAPAEAPREHRARHLQPGRYLRA